MWEWVRDHEITLGFLVLLVLGAGVFTRMQVYIDDDVQRSCRQDVVSWETRNELIDAITAPSVIAPENEGNLSLVAQINAANARKARQHDSLTKLNGARPRC